MLFQDLNNSTTANKVSTILISAGVLTGIFVGYRKFKGMGKGIWPIAGYALLFGAAGGVLGIVYKNVTTTTG